MGRAGKVFLLAVIILGIVWFLFVGIIAEHSSKARKKAGPYSSAKFVEHWKSIERERRFRHQEMGFHVVSKRRIPNGPNPIHNRRASKTKQQPGRVQDLRVR